jgi:hypothetical protein
VVGTFGTPSGADDSQAAICIDLTPWRRPNPAAAIAPGAGPLPEATMLWHVAVAVALRAFRICGLRSVQGARGHFQLKLSYRGVNHREALLAEHHTKGKP